MFALYVIVNYSVAVASGVPYPEIFASTENVWRGVVVVQIVDLVIAVGALTLLGWWRPALWERARSPHRWLIIAPALALGTTLVRFSSTDWASIPLDFLLATGLTVVLVGFNEEMFTRGILIVGFRGSVREVWVWLASAALFGLMHLSTFFRGQDLGATLLQVLTAFVVGTVLYELRRVGGTLLWCMLLHALWDFGAFVYGYAPAPLNGPASAVYLGLMIGTYLLGLICVGFAIRGAREGFGRRAPVG